MSDLEYQAEKLHQQREANLYPKAALLAPIESELGLERQRKRRSSRRPVRWAGAGMVAVGHRLMAVGEWLAPPHPDQVQPTTMTIDRHGTVLDLPPSS